MDALGAGSSVIAVVSLAVQLGSNIQRLADFWDSVKEAPAEVEQIKTELQVLGSLVGSIAKDAGATTGPGDVSHQCLAACTASIGKLERLSRDLDNGLKGNGIKRKWTCLKKALREKQLASYWSETERAKSMLIMYQCLRNGQRHESLFELIAKTKRDIPFLRSFENSVSGRNQVALQQEVRNSYTLTKTNLGCSKFELYLSFGTVRVRLLTYAVTLKRQKDGARTSVIAKPKYRQTLITFLPNFNKWPMLDWTFGRQFNSIKAGLQCFNLRPGWSPIFEFCSTGDLESVQRLIEEGHASPYDIDPDGWTPLHCAAEVHHTEICRMLMDMGAVPDALTNRQETPLQLALRWSCRLTHACPVLDEAACIDTVRFLVEHGRNDPMLTNDIGFNAVFTAARNKSTQAVIWLMNQDTYEVDLHHRGPGGISAASILSGREDLSESYISPLLRNGISINSPCISSWRFRRRPEDCNEFVVFIEPTMLQCTAWNWFDQLLDSACVGLLYEYESEHRQRPNSPLVTMRTLLDHGADFHALSGSRHTLLDGLVLNLIQFDTNGRPLDVFVACLDTWIDLVQDLGFDVKDYIRAAAAEQKDTYHNLGMCLKMKICFNEESRPHIWTEFQGPHERERGECVDHISKCAIWKDWQAAYTLPELPFTQSLTRDGWLTRFKPEMIVIQERTSSDSPITQSTFKIDEQNRVLRYRNRGASFNRIRHIAMYHYLHFATKYRYEFTFYIAVFTCFFCSWVARLWITTAFFMTLKLLENSIM